MANSPKLVRLEPADPSLSSWREQAVARRLDPARARAEDRVQRFLDAALELMSSTGSDFTVQEIVQTSGQSLRSFYQYFSGKHELLLALFEESVATTAESLRAQLSVVHGADARLRTFITGYYQACRSTRPRKGSKSRTNPAMVDFAQELLTSHADQATRAFAPVVDLFDDVLADAVAAGVVRADLNRRRVAGVILEAIMFNAFSRTIGGVARSSGEGDASAEFLDVVLHGISAS